VNGGEDTKAGTWGKDVERGRKHRAEWESEKIQGPRLLIKRKVSQLILVASRRGKKGGKKYGHTINEREKQRRTGRG